MTVPKHVKYSERRTKVFPTRNKKNAANFVGGLKGMIAGLFTHGMQQDLGAMPELYNPPSASKSNHLRDRMSRGYSKMSALIQRGINVKVKL